MHHPPPHPHSRRIPIIPRVNPLLHPLLPTLPAKNIHGARVKPALVLAPLPNFPQINHLRIELLTDVEPAYFVREADDRGTAPGGEVERFLGAEFGAVAEGGLEREVAACPDGVACVFEDAGVEAVRHVGAEADGVAFVEERADGRAAAGDGGVAAGAVGDGRAAGEDGLALFFAEVDRVGEDGLRGEQVMRVVDVGVGFAGGEERLDEGDFAFVFGDVRLDEGGFVACEFGD